MNEKVQLSCQLIGVSLLPTQLVDQSLAFFTLLSWK